MIEKVVHRADLKTNTETAENLSYWLSKKPAERIAAVEFLRRQYDGNPDRLQRVAHVVKLSPEDTK